MTKLTGKTSLKECDVLAPQKRDVLHRWMPLVSVVMVCHRNTPYVRPAVDSIFDQTLSDWEFVFVSNGSGLAPSDLGAMGSDPRLRWVELSENMGVSRGLNAGIAAVTGDRSGICPD